MKTQIETTIKRARAYWFIDGFTEIATGGLFIALAVALFVSKRTTQTSFPSWFLSVTGEIVILKVISFLIVALLLWWLKDHFTYPRTGFVRNQITWAQIFFIIRNVVIFLLLPVIVLFGISVFITSTGSVIASMPVWFPTGLGLIWAIFILLTGEWMGLQRFRWLSVITLLTGISVGIWQLAIGLPNISTSVEPNILIPSFLESVDRTISSLGVVLVIFGVILLISGMMTFLNYRKENPTPYSEEI